MLVVLIDDAGFGNPSTFGGPIATPELRPDGRSGRQVQPLPRDRDVLARRERRCSPGATTTRSGWAASPSSPVASRATRRCCRETRAVPEGPEGERVRTAGIGKWHLTPGGRAGPGRAVQPLAQRLGLRLLLGIPGARGRPVRHDDRREPEVHRRPGGQGRQGVLLPRGDDRPGDRLVARRARPRSREAVDAVLLDRLQPRASPRRQGMVATSTRASSTRAGTSCARRRSPARRQLGVVPADAELTPRDEGCRPGTRCRRTASGSSPTRWRSTPGTRRTPTTTSAGCWTRSRRWASSTTRSSCGSGATTAPAWKARPPAPSTRARWSTACR